MTPSARKCGRRSVRRSTSGDSGTGRRRRTSRAGLSLARAARRADVAAGTIRRWIREGRLTARRAGRVYRIGHDELERFLASDVRRASIVSVARAFLAGAG